MTVVPVRALPSSTSHDSPAPRLHVVPAHEHTWQLRSVEYDETFEVRRYECDDCDDVLYR